MIERKPAIDPQGLGRRRPRMAAAVQTRDPNIRAVTAPEPPAVPPTVRTVGPNPRGGGTCPNCGASVARLATHLRQCNA